MRFLTMSVISTQVQGVKLSTARFSTHAVCPESRYQMEIDSGENHQTEKKQIKLTTTFIARGNQIFELRFTVVGLAQYNKLN